MIPLLGNLYNSAMKHTYSNDRVKLKQRNNATKKHILFQD